MTNEPNREEAPRSKGGAFSPRLTADLLPGRFEFLIALIVVGSVFGVAWLIFEMPGPLDVQVVDDLGAPVMGARVSCSDARGERKFSGISDVFGETKWPGLTKEMWFCEARPPDRFHGAMQDGSAPVHARSPATVRFRFERPVHVNIQVKRPHGAARSAVAVRAVCPATQTAPEARWEARASILSGNTLLWLPFGRECRAGLVKPSLPTEQGAIALSSELDCTNEPCTGLLSANIGGDIDTSIEPTLEQWNAVRPPPRPDDEPDGGIVPR